MVLIVVHTLTLLSLVILGCLAVLVAWVLVLLLLGCGRRPVEVRGGAGYLPGPRIPPAYPAKGWHEWPTPARARGRRARLA